MSELLNITNDFFKLSNYIDSKKKKIVFIGTITHTGRKYYKYIIITKTLCIQLEQFDILRIN